MVGLGQNLYARRNFGFCCFAMGIDIAQIKRQTEFIYTIGESQEMTVSVH